MELSSPEAVVDEIIDACLSMRGLPYDGEPVDQLEHALQCAALAADGAKMTSSSSPVCCTTSPARRRWQGWPTTPPASITARRARVG